MGATVEIPTPEGRVSLKVPAGSQDGKMLRVKGRGSPRLNGSGRGDLLARLRVSIPSKLSKAEREALENYEKAAQFEPTRQVVRMSDELDRLLAQGPHVAPEPRTASDDGALVSAPAPVAPSATTTVETPAGTRRPRGAAGPGSAMRPAVWRRLIPVLFGLIVVARAVGNGRIEAAVFGLLAVAVVTLILVRKARQL